MPRLVSAFAGPVLIGLGSWCAAGDLAVATAGSTVRLAVPAPWWVLVAGFTVAAASPSWRRSVWLAAPALFSVVPWLPVPLPAVALVWTGPMAWVPVAVAVAIGPGRELAGALVRALLALRPARAQVLAAAISLVVGIAAAWSVAPRLPGGDEPHYLVITQSLLGDGDLRIENNHANRDYAEYFGGTINPDYLVRGQDDEIYSIHAPGVSALVAPAFAAFGYRGAQAMVLLLAVLTSGVIWRAAFELTDDASAAWFGWAAVTLSITFVIQSVTIFPDGPGALAVAAACLLLVRLGPDRIAPGAVALVVVGTMLAGLPWLHTRFAVLAAGFGTAIAWRLWLAGGDAPARLRRLTAFLAVPTVSALLWFGFFWTIYGTPNPTAPYGTSPETSVTFVPGGLLGLLFDQQFGLFVAAPALLAAVAGVAGRKGGASRRWAFGIVAVYFAVVCTYWMWWAGRPASPARFTAAALPALALPAAWAWRRAAAGGRALWLAALSLSVSLTAVLVFVGRGALAWNDRTANSLLFEWLGPVVDLPRGLPSFFQALDPARLETEWPFALHVLVTALVLLVVVSGFRHLARRAGPTDVRRAVLALAGLLGAMAIVQAGWWLQGASPVDPARAQAQLLGASEPGATVWRLEGARLSRVPIARSGLRLVPETPGRTAPPDAPATFVDLPPVRARVLAATDRPANAVLPVRVGRSAGLLRLVGVDAGSGATELTLPAGAGTLAFGPLQIIQPSPVPSAAVRIVLEPSDRLSDVGGLAVLATNLGDPAVEAHVLDDHVFLESRGLWVRGGQSTAIVWRVPGQARGHLALTLRNGGAENEVRVLVGGEWRTHAMAPSESMVLELPVVGEIASLSVVSPSGFRPADVGGGDDRRYLGVWIEPR